jgi:hypothetical protein
MSPRFAIFMWHGHFNEETRGNEPKEQSAPDSDADRVRAGA